MGILWFLTKIPIKIIITPLTPIIHLLISPLDQLAGQPSNLWHTIASLWKW